MEPENLYFVDLLLTVGIIPIIGALWWLNRRTSALEREMSSVLSTLRANAKSQEATSAAREQRRQEDREDMHRAFTNLRADINSLTTRVSEMAATNATLLAHLSAFTRNPGDPGSSGMSTNLISGLPPLARRKPKPRKDQQAPQPQQPQQSSGNDEDGDE